MSGPAFPGYPPREDGESYVDYSRRAQRVLLEWLEKKDEADLVDVTEGM